MKERCRKLKAEIERQARRINIDPRKESFKPETLEIDASQYGSFSDHCSKDETKSAKYCGCGLFKLNKKMNEKGFWYLLNK